jgi:hypothetical protein
MRMEREGEKTMIVWDQTVDWDWEFSASVRDLIPGETRRDDLPEFSDDAVNSACCLPTGLWVP